MASTFIRSNLLQIFGFEVIFKKNFIEEIENLANVKNQILLQGRNTGSDQWHAWHNSESCYNWVLRVDLETRWTYRIPPVNVWILSEFLWAYQRPSGFTLQTDRREVLDSVPYRTCRPSFSEFSVDFIVTPLNTCYDSLEKKNPRWTFPPQVQVSHADIWPKFHNPTLWAFMLQLPSFVWVVSYISVGLIVYVQRTAIRNLIIDTYFLFFFGSVMLHFRYL